MPYIKIPLEDSQVSVIKSIISEAVSSRDADNAPKATMRGMDIRLGLLGDGVYVTSDVKAGWSGQATRELAGGTLQRVAVFVGRVTDGCVTASGYVALLKFTSSNNHITRYYLEVSVKPSELGTDADSESLFADTLSVLGFKDADKAVRQQVDLDSF
jgi:hypothetical protein